MTVDSEPGGRDPHWTALPLRVTTYSWARNAHLTGCAIEGGSRIATGAMVFPALAGHRAVFLVAQVLGHTWFSAVSSTVLVSCLSSPIGAGQRQALSRARATSSSATRSAAVGSASFFVTSSSVAVITAPLPPSRQAQPHHVACPAQGPAAGVLAVPRVLGIDDFALRRGSVCATVLMAPRPAAASTSSRPHR